jgi:hypothetical protein
LRGLTSTINVASNSFLQYGITKDKKELYHAITASLGNVSPFNLQGDDTRELSESVISNMTPVFKSYLELSTNRDTFRHTDLIPDSYGKGSMLQKYKAGKIKVYEVRTKHTPEWAITLSKSLYDSTGIEMTPITIDYLQKTFLGNISQSVKGNAISRRILRSKGNYPVYHDYSK